LYSNDHSYYVVFKSQAGWIGISGSSLGISRTTLPQISQEMAILSLGKTISGARYSIDYFQDLINDFINYFSGKEVYFPQILDLTQATVFECSVWETTRKIHYGEWRSYSWIAQQIGKPQAPRAVGQALGRNPLPIIIPCHRVLASDGQLRGFGGGLEMKQYLLDLETKSNYPSS
jgi:methylated-DNA-[protein]-cysteine S-methyltransferase